MLMRPSAPRMGRPTRMVFAARRCPKGPPSVSHAIGRSIRGLPIAITTEATAAFQPSFERSDGHPPPAPATPPPPTPS